MCRQWLNGKDAGRFVNDVSRVLTAFVRRKAVDRILVHIDRLKRLEDQKKWYEACEYLYHQWRQDKANANMLVRTL